MSTLRELKLSSWNGERTKVSYCWEDGTIPAKLANDSFISGIVDGKWVINGPNNETVRATHVAVAECADRPGRLMSNIEMAFWILKPGDREIREWKHNGKSESTQHSCNYPIDAENEAVDADIVVRSLLRTPAGIIITDWRKPTIDLLDPIAE